MERRQLIVKSSSWCLAAEIQKLRCSALFGIREEGVADGVGLVDGGAGEGEWLESLLRETEQTQPIKEQSILPYSG